MYTHSRLYLRPFRPEKTRDTRQRQKARSAPRLGAAAEKRTRNIHSIEEPFIRKTSEQKPLSVHAGMHVGTWNARHSTLARNFSLSSFLLGVVVVVVAAAENPLCISLPGRIFDVVVWGIKEPRQPQRAALFKFDGLFFR